MTKAIPEPATAAPASSTLGAPVADQGAGVFQAQMNGLTSGPITPSAQPALSPQTSATRDTAALKALLSQNASVQPAPVVPVTLASTVTAATMPLVAQVAALIPGKLVPGVGVSEVQSAKPLSKPGGGLSLSTGTPGQLARPQAVSTAPVPMTTVEPASLSSRTGGGEIKSPDRGTLTLHDVHKSATENGAASATGSNAATVTSIAPGGEAQASSVSVGPSAGSTGTADASMLTPVILPPPAAQLSSLGAGQSAAGDKHDGPAETAVSGAASVDAHALPSIDTAKVIQSMQGSEMRVGMHSAEFGNISVSTLLNRESIAAQISFEHTDLGKVLTAHLPSIEAKLSSDYGMHARVEVRDHSMGASGENGRGDGRRGDGSASNPGATAAASLTGSTLNENGSALVANSIPNGLLTESLRLDVRA